METEELSFNHLFLTHRDLLTLAEFTKHYSRRAHVPPYRIRRGNMQAHILIFNFWYCSLLQDPQNPGCIKGEPNKNILSWNMQSITPGQLTSTKLGQFQTWSCLIWGNGNHRTSETLEMRLLWCLSLMRDEYRMRIGWKKNIKLQIWIYSFFSPLISFLISFLTNMSFRISH